MREFSADYKFCIAYWNRNRAVPPDGRAGRLAGKERRLFDIISGGGMVFDSEREFKAWLTGEGWIRVLAGEQMFLFNRVDRRIHGRAILAEIFSNLFVMEGSVLKKACDYVWKGLDSDEYPLWYVKPEAMTLFDGV
jgi:hypothetical protein